MSKNKTSPFRVHFADGQKVDVQAASVDAARKQAVKQHPTGDSIVTKIKLIRGQS
ncbi:hypothetical protein MAUB1S_09671 [Mycolicibacterium aubagnense]